VAAAEESYGDKELKDEMKIRRWGIVIGRFSMCWLDLWTGRWGFEVAFGRRRITGGFGEGIRRNANSTSIS
jgi:hypothetical protein